MNDHVGVLNLVKDGIFQGHYDLTTHFPNFYTIMYVIVDVHLFRICISACLLAPIIILSKDYHFKVMNKTLNRLVYLL